MLETTVSYQNDPGDPGGSVAETQVLQDLLEKVANLTPGDERTCTLAKRAQSLAETLSDPERSAKSALLLAGHYLSTRAYQRVVDTLEPYLATLFYLPDPLKSQLLLSLIEAYRALTSVSKVLRYGAEALKLSQTQEDSLKQAKLHGYLGEAYTRFCAHHEALEHYLAQLELLKSCGAPQAEPYVGIGLVYMELVEYAKALTFYQEGLDRAQDEGNEIVAGRCIGNMANVYRRTSRYAESLTHHQRAIDIFKARKEFHRTVTGYSNLARVYHEMGDTARALSYFDKTFAQLKRTPNQAAEGWALIRLGELYLDTDSLKAETTLLKGIDKSTKAGSNEGVEAAHHLLCKLYEKQGKFQKALEHYRIYAEFQMQQLKDQNEKRTQALSIRFEVEHLQQAQEIYELKNVELARAVEQLEELSTRDALTGLYNRRYLDKHLAQVFLDAEATAQPLTVLISDIDNFKAVNDTLSHAVGDDVLRIVAQIFENNTWGADVVARYGGEEFVIVFRETTLTEAFKVAEKLRGRIETYPWHKVQKDLAVTVSMGLCNDLSLGDHEKMLAVADDKLYDAKRTGKNKVVA